MAYDRERVHEDLELLQVNIGWRSDAKMGWRDG